MSKIIPLAFLFFLIFCRVCNANKDSINIVYANSWAPMSYGNYEDVSGVFPTLVEKLFSDNLQYNVIHQGVPWGRAQNMIKYGQADGFLAPLTDERILFSNSTKKPLYKMEFRAYTLQNSEAASVLIKHQNELTLPKTVKFCDVLGNGWAKEFYAKRQVSYYLASNISNCLKMIENKRMDAIIHFSTVISFKLQELGLENKIKPLPKVHKTVNFMLMISKKSPYAKKIISDVNFLYK